jgi:hypothetical protein
MSWHRGVTVIVSAVVWFAAVPSLGAASFSLTATQQEDAKRAGKRSVVTEDWTGEWRVTGGPGQYAVVMTPFHRLAMAARNAAFKSQDLATKDVESVLRDTEGQLTVWATLRGPRADFARHFAPALTAGSEEIKPSFVQNERTALREEDGKYTARCLYVFPTERLDARGTVTLLVRDADERPVARFTLNLSTMR